MLKSKATLCLYLFVYVTNLLVVLWLQEVWKYWLVVPAFVSQCCPVVIVLPVTTHVHHPIQDSSPTHHLPWNNTWLRGQLVANSNVLTHQSCTDEEIKNRLRSANSNSYLSVQNQKRKIKIYGAIILCIVWYGYETVRRVKIYVRFEVFMAVRILKVFWEDKISELLGSKHSSNIVCF